jgi:hypothetical protein
MSIRSKCQKLWIKAATGEDVVLEFLSQGDRERAKFAIYDACRKSTDPELAKAKELVEVRKGKNDLTMTMSLKSKNPYHKDLEGQLNSLLGGMEPAGMTEIERSLKKLQDSIKGEKVERPGNKYFDRGEE